MPLAKPLENKPKSPIVISLGGSLLFSQETTYDEKFLANFAALILKLSKQVPLAIVVGGGNLAKKYCLQARAKGHNDFFADREAIIATVENCRKVVQAIGSSAKIADSFDEFQNALDAGKIPVGHGMLEGITTDTVSMLAAERINARTVVNASKVDGLYDADPAKNPNAKRYNRLTHNQLVSLAVQGDQRSARTNFPFDLIACKLSARSNTAILFVDGKKLDEVEKAVLGQKYDGTVVLD